MSGIKRFVLQSLVVATGATLALLSLPLVLGMGALMLLVAVAARIYLAFKVRNLPRADVRPYSYATYYASASSSGAAGGRPVHEAS